MAEAVSDPARAALISNNESGANRRYGIERIHQRATAAGLCHYRISDMAALDEVLRECAQRDTRLIIINAGDGTVCRLLDLLRSRDWFREEPPLALLRGGTTNMIHGDVGWPGRPDAALESLLTCLREERVARRERHVLRVRPEGSDTAHHGFFFGTHAIVRAIVRTRARFHQRGMRGTVSELLSATALVWRLLRRNIDRDPVLAPISLELRRGDGPWRRTSHILLMATSLRRLILGARPLAAGQRAGLAELSGPDYRLLPWLWRLFRGRIEALETLSLRGDVEWILDGEIHRHHAADGALTVEPAEPAAFLVRRSRS